jgi:chemotaxis protein CheX
MGNDMLTTMPFKDVVVAAAKEVFETMVMMALEPVGEEAPDIEETTLLGKITFSGGVEGCLNVRCGQSCARSVAANMLCVEPPDELSEADVNDAIGEIANMVMGAVKTRVQDELPDISISIPTVIQGRELKTRLGEGTIKVVIKANIGEEYPVEFSLLYRQSGQ